MSTLKAMVRSGGAAGALLLSILLTSACVSSSSSTEDRLTAIEKYRETGRSVGCHQLLRSAFTREHSGDTSGAINGELERLGAQCPRRYKIFIDYTSMKSFAETGAAGSCAEYAGFGLDSRAIQKAKRDGYCSTARGNAEPPKRWTCTYAPTMNDNWHDDVVCANGVKEGRPYLRAGDNFITPEEMKESARDYEDQLNR
jgi:hypothetical protein